MASYSFLLDYAGFSFDVPKRQLGFAPLREGDVSFFWVLEGAWGIFERRGGENHLKVLYGTLELKTLLLPQLKTVAEVLLGDKASVVRVQDGALHFDHPLRIGAGEVLRVV